MYNLPYKDFSYHTDIYPNVKEYVGNSTRLSTWVRIKREGVYYMVKCSQEYVHNNTVNELAQALRVLHKEVYKLSVLYTITAAAAGHVFIDMIQIPEYQRLIKGYPPYVGQLTIDSRGILTSLSTDYSTVGVDIRLLRLIQKHDYEIKINP